MRVIGEYELKAISGGICSFLAVLIVPTCYFTGVGLKAGLNTTLKAMSQAPTWTDALINIGNLPSELYHGGSKGAYVGYVVTDFYLNVVEPSKG